MLKTLLVFAHLIATCAAIGTIVITDLRLAAKAMGYRVVIPPPERFETYLITAALSVLYLTGAAIVWMGWQANPDYLANPKLQAKLVLVAVLTLNAIVLHKMVFPVLSRSRPVSRWSRRDWMVVASSVSLSNSLWFFCAFLGIARPWNGTVSLVFVLTVAASMWAIVFALVNILLTLASRDAPKAKPDWIDSMKASLSDFADLREH
jgi:NADH:ubiquinone oxidoreductase subunit K